MSPIAIGARRLFVLVALVLRISPVPIATAQEYVPRTLSVAEGLANERLSCILQDRKGYIWFGTWEGLSRFDGAEFSTLTTQDGLGKDGDLVFGHGPPHDRFLSDADRAPQLGKAARM